MNLIPLLSAVILMITIVAITVRAGSYLAVKVRESRHADTGNRIRDERERKQFFIPYIPDDEGTGRVKR